jgi:hypothetical protein
LLALWIIGRDVAHQYERAVDLLARDAEGVDDALRIFPFVESRDLYD